MQCAFCRVELGNTGAPCPGCRRPHAAWVSWCLTQGWQAFRAGQAKAAQQSFREALRVTPAAEAATVSSYLPPGFDLSAAPVLAAAPAPPPRVAANKGSRSIVHDAFAPCVALYFTVNDRPREVVRVMDAAAERQRTVLMQNRRRDPLVYALLVLGFLGFVGDVVASYGTFVLGYAGLVCWAAAVALHHHVAAQRAQLLASVRKSGWFMVLAMFACLLAALVLAVGVITQDDDVTVWGALGVTLLLAFMFWRRTARARVRLATPFDERFGEARTLLETLADDLPRRFPLLGWLDLTGLTDAKVVRQATGGGGAPLTFYRDEWLRLKLKLADGNVLRLSAVESVRKKDAFWKQGSRKLKRRPGVTDARHLLKVSVVVNTNTHSVRKPPTHGSLQHLALTTELATDDRLVVCAAAAQRLNASHILQVLKLVYSHVTPRTATG